MIASLLALVLTSSSSAATTTVEMGDGQINGLKIAPYKFIWAQCMVKDGQWQTGSPLTETATLIGDHVLRIEQTGEMPGGVKSKVTYFVDRTSLAPIRTERAFTTPDGKLLASQELVFDEKGYQSTGFKQGKHQEKTGTLTSNMYDAMILGLPLSTLDFQKGNYALQAFMISFDASYIITASKTGQETISHDGAATLVNWIDVEWVHEQIGDVYPPGPDAIGGRYWIRAEAGDMLPRVIRYQTDSYAIEYLPGVCPKPQAEEPGESSSPSPE